ncbi:unnamed protein product [Clonostachys byssicola]|uniref:Uncharacterized protein n=1 Tax=Clonostachys byssicola TaxID=160290 RepID=A0A9N9Y5N1_9HYPO|nr:unnamed protein product [Clonostachys byssicola]
MSPTRRLQLTSSSPSSLRSAAQKSLQCRFYAQPTSKPSRAEQEIKRLAKAAASNTKEHALPARVLIFHAGTARTTFIALLKVTSLFIGAFFCGIVVPTYIKSEKPVWDTAQVLLCGIVPPIFVAFTTASFVTHVHVNLPSQARASKTVLERFIRSEMPPSTKVTLTTMSFIAKPRQSTMAAGDLLPAKRRFGLINYIRRPDSAAQENANRKWYMWRAVDKFYIQEGRPGQPRKVRYQTPKPDLVQWWIWEAIQQKIAKDLPASK